MRQRLIVLLIIAGPFVVACTPSERPSRKAAAGVLGSDSQPLGALHGQPDTNTRGENTWPLEPAPDGWRDHEATDIPLVAGFTEVVAVREPQGDYESIGSVQSVTPATVTHSFSVRSAAVSGGASNRARRIVSRQDMEGARGYRMTFSSADPESFPGQTAVGISSAVFRELQVRGRSRIDLYASTDAVAAVAAIMSALGAESSDLTGELSRADSEPVGVPVLVNGRRVWLPAVHATGELQRIDGSVRVEFWFLADSRNPLTLRAAIDRTRLQVVRIDFPNTETASVVERALADRQPVEMWGVYFEFGSAKLQPESITVLDEIASVLRRHPDWRVRIEGHTDDVGSETDNLRLSQQRADAVRTELARLLGGGGNRLDVAGYGASRPRESNATLSGRARNRRVELTRQ